MRSGSAAGVLLGLLGAVPGAAQVETGPLGLEDCIALARAAQSGVHSARQQRQIAALGASQARAALLPQVRVDGAFTYNSPLADAPGVPSHVALNGIREYLGLVSVVQEVDLSGRLRSARARARAEEAAAEAGLGIAERDLRRQVAASHYRVLLARRLAEVARDTLEESRAFAARTRLLLGQGEAARADVVKAEAQAAFLAQAVEAADLEAEIANHELASFWTTEVAKPIPLRNVLDEPLPEPPAPELPAASSAPFLRRPEFRLFEAQQQGFLAEARGARAGRRPQATFTFQYGLDATRLDWHDHGYAAFVALAIPVFDWSKSSDAARQLELQSAQIDTSRRVAERAFSREYEDALSRVRMTYGQITTTRAQVQLSEQDLRLSRVRYEGGEGSALDVVTAQSQLVQARANHYTAVTRYLLGRAELEAAGGGPNR